MTTLAALIQKVITRISQVPGTGVQLYAEDRIADMIQQTFDMIFESYWWPQFHTDQTMTLDGTTGQITGDISSFIKRYQDVHSIFYENNTHPTPEMPKGFNPGTVTGSEVRLFGPNATASKLVRFYPFTATGNVRFIGRTKPANFTVNDEVPFDDTALIFAATRDYLEDDAANPGAIEKFEQLTENRLKQLKDSMDNHPRALDPRINQGNDEWRELN